MNHLIKQRSDKGFTIIELMLAMAFISMLLLAIALTLVQIATIYNRGNTMKQVNQSSREITTQLTNAMTSSGSFSLLPADHRYVEQEQSGVVIGGRLCVGTYSYIWNYGTALSTVSSYRNIYLPGATKAQLVSTNYVKLTATTGRNEISLVKAPDASGAYCVPTATTASGYPDINPVGATEILRTGDHGLVLHYLHITTSPTAADSLSAQQLYKATFVLGTPDVSALTGLATPDVACLPPGTAGADPNYCSVQKFTLVLRVVSGVN